MGNKMKEIFSQLGVDTLRSLDRILQIDEYIEFESYDKSFTFDTTIPSGASVCTT